LNTQNAVAHLQRLDELGLLPHVVPELEPLKGVTQSSPHRFDVWRHTLMVVDTLEGVIAAVTEREAGSRTLAGVPSAAWGDLARSLGMLLVGFSRGASFNVYAGAARLTG